MKTFTSESGSEIAEGGIAMIRKQTIVFMSQQPRPFLVECGSGVLTGEAGDYVAYDPIVNMVWPIKECDVTVTYDLADDVLLGD